MNIIKLGHCCLLIEVDGMKLLTDPGMFSTSQNEIENIDVVLITHEHQDHFHLESLKVVLKNNPKAKIVPNRGVGKLLEKERIGYELLEDKQSKTVSGILLEGFGEKHATIYQDFGQVQNTGYFVGNRFFYPGDALYNPRKSVEILALPVAGPWRKMAEAIDYAKLLKPKVCFPVHDGMLSFTGPTRSAPQKFLPSADIEFRNAIEGTELVF